MTEEDETMKQEYKTDDLIIPMITFPSPTPVRVVIDEKYVRLYVGPRDWQWDKETGKCVGAGTALSCAVPDEEPDTEEGKVQ